MIAHRLPPLLALLLLAAHTGVARPVDPPPPRPLGGPLVFTLADVTLPAAPRLLRAFDADADGDPDLAVVGSGFAQLAHQVSVLDNDGAGGFTLGWSSPHPPTEYELGTTQIAAADLDLDGQLDVTITPSADFWSTRLGNGQGELSAFLRGTLAGGYGVHGTVGDIDQDGLPDLAQYNVDFGGTYIDARRGTGDGLFVGFTCWQGNLPDTETLVLLADLDEDGQPEPVVSTQQGLFRAPPAGSSFIQILAGAFRGFAILDLDDDDELDIVFTEPLGDRFGVLLGTGGGSYGAPSWFATGDGPDQLEVADVDGDGEFDVITGNVLAGTISILLGDGAGSFGGKQDIATGSGPLGIAAADFDLDGDTDVAVADAGATTVTILLQQP